MEDLLQIAHEYPRRTVDSDELLVADGEPLDTLFVLIEGSLRIEKRGTPVAYVTAPGSCVGEMSLLLGTPATADVRAREPSELAVVESASTMIEREPALALVLARLLAARLLAMTTYLVDLKEQYADHEGGLGMVDVVLESLLRAGSRSQLGSERDPDPEY
jgi:CRP/FNR family cyclic AMP-dependent transcriptional regulator